MHLPNLPVRSENPGEPVDSRPALVAVVGPTAVGKTELAIQIAERLDGEIVSADSRLFYRGMDIGTAKPTLVERSRVPHHLIDVADPDEIWSLAIFQEQACLAIASIHARRRLPILVGGTGQYIRSVAQGWKIPRVEPEQRLRLALEAWADQVGPTGLHRCLAALDPQAAVQIDPRNLRRTIRALEVIFTTGQRFSKQRQQGQSPYRLLMIGLQRPRLELYTRIDARIDAMLGAGLEGEVRLLLQVYSPDLPTLSAIGYAEMIRYLEGDISLEEAVAQIKRSTRIFVRRQANWFKPTDESIHWFGFSPDSFDEILMLIQAFILS